MARRFDELATERDRRWYRAWRVRMAGVFAALMLGFLAIALAAAVIDGSRGDVLALGVLTALGGLAIGAFLGFLFGVPRSGDDEGLGIPGHPGGIVPWTETD